MMKYLEDLLWTHIGLEFKFKRYVGCPILSIIKMNLKRNPDNLSLDAFESSTHKLTTLVKHATLFYLYVDVSKILYSFFHFHINPTVQ